MEQRGWRAVAGVLGVAWACGGPGRVEVAREPVQVELLEEEVARVVPVDGGEARTVPRAELPVEVREGDVVMEGRVDPAERRRREEEVAKLRRRMAVSLPDGLEMDPGPSRALTHGKED